MKQALIALALPLVVLAACGDSGASRSTNPGSPVTSVISGSDSGGVSSTAETAETAEGVVADTADGGVVIVGDPQLYALIDLSSPQMCALFPLADVQAIVGAELEAGTGMQLDGLGTNCLYNTPGDLSIVAKFEFGALPWKSIVSLITITLDTTAAVPQACIIGGRPAMCTDKGKGALNNSASVYVQLGGDDDISLLVQSDISLEIATKLAEYAMSQLPD